MVVGGGGWWWVLVVTGLDGLVVARLEGVLLVSVSVCCSRVLGSGGV